LYYGNIPDLDDTVSVKRKKGKNIRNLFILIGFTKFKGKAFTRYVQENTPFLWSINIIYKHFETDPKQISIFLQQELL
jgi:hypothetical protein